MLVSVYVDDMVPYPIDIASAPLQLEGFVSATHVWSQVITNVKEDLSLRHDTWITEQHTGKRVLVDQLWRTERLLKMFPRDSRLGIQGRAVVPGYVLQDYGVLNTQNTGDHQVPTLV